MDEQNRESWSRNFFGEEREDERDGNVAVIVSRGGKRERAPRALVAQTGRAAQQHRERNTERQRSESDQWRQPDVAGLGKGFVTENGIEDQARRKDVDGDPQQARTSIGGKPIQLTQCDTSAGDAEDGHGAGHC